MQLPDTEANKGMIAEHERLVLTADLPEHGLEAGDVGTVVYVYQGGRAYEVEFFTLGGETAAVATVEAAQRRPISRRDITHARTAAAPAA